MLRRLLVSWIISAIAVGLTAGLLPGISIDGGFGTLLLIAAVWGFVNGIIGPFARLISLPLTLMTFGLFAFVVNALLFAFTAWVVDALHIDNFLWALVGVIVLSLVTFILSWFTGRFLLGSESRRA
jgi:putative membrane protein